MKTRTQLKNRIHHLEAQSELATQFRKYPEYQEMLRLKRDLDTCISSFEAEKYTEVLHNTRKCTRELRRRQLELLYSRSVKLVSQQERAWLRDFSKWYPKYDIRISWISPDRKYAIVTRAGDNIYVSGKVVYRPTDSWIVTVNRKLEIPTKVTKGRFTNKTKNTLIFVIKSVCLGEYFVRPIPAEV